MEPRSRTSHTRMLSEGCMDRPVLSPYDDDDDYEEEEEADVWGDDGHENDKEDDTLYWL